jgi:hypothetical protein
MDVQRQVAADDAAWNGRSSVLAYQEIPDARFTDPGTLYSKSLVVDPCDAAKVDVNLVVQNPGRTGYYNLN